MLEMSLSPSGAMVLIGGLDAGGGRTETCLDFMEKGREGGPLSFWVMDMMV